MYKYRLQKDYEYISSQYLNKVDDLIINLYDTENKYDNYILKYNDEFALIRLLVEKSNATLVFYITDINNLVMIEETKKLITYIRDKLNKNIFVLLLKDQVEYINFFKSMGFVQNIIYREYVLIEDKYYDILSYTLYKGRYVND